MCIIVLVKCNKLWYNKDNEKGVLYKGGAKMAENKNSKARIEANNRYNAKAYDRINIAVPKGQKDIIKAHAEQNGESINGFVNRAIDETMQRETNE